MKPCRAIKVAYGRVPSPSPLVQRLTWQPWSTEEKGRNRMTASPLLCTIVSRSWVVAGGKVMVRLFMQDIHEEN
jgi:hypothetical protein